MTKTICFRLTEEEYQFFLGVAQETGATSISALARHAIEQFAHARTGSRNITKLPGRVNESIRAIERNLNQLRADLALDLSD